MAGAIAADRSCKGTTNHGGCHSKGTTNHGGCHSWKDVIISATIKIQAKNYQARVKIEESQINLFGGVTCIFLPGNCFDTTLGESVWMRHTHISCEDRLSLLY
ncbi:hypothetical protein JTB14_002746 [Gonioctena quinquepunctata]|nr:hypothetical protein JTB14_002746 [Gonioctena quinquepunctata]